MLTIPARRPEGTAAIWGLAAFGIILDALPRKGPRVVPIIIYFGHGLALLVRQGDGKYLRGLFSEGPVTQGSRIANLRTPAYAIEPSFGTSY